MLSLPMVIFGLGPNLVRAQEVGATLSGSVTDPSASGIPSASIEVTNQATGISVKTTSSENGDYTVPALSPGTYRLTAAKEGFKTAVLNDITLVVFQRARMDVHLDVGDVSSKVEVEGVAAQVDATSATVAGTVENRRIVDLPLNLRRFGQLAILFPGVQDNGGFASTPSALRSAKQLIPRMDVDREQQLSCRRHRHEELYVWRFLTLPVGG